MNAKTAKLLNTMCAATGRNTPKLRRHAKRVYYATPRPKRAKLKKFYRSLIMAWEETQEQQQYKELPL